MAVESGWTDEELKAAVTAYLSMLHLEQAGTPYSKSEFRRQLIATSLSARNDSSVEYRMQNISSVMESMGRPRVAGYRPASNIGTASVARLKRIIEDLEEPNREKVTLQVRDIVATPDLIMGVKAVFGRVSSHVLCFGSRGNINDKSYFSVAAGAARRATTSPYVITIGGGRNVQHGLDGRVLNVARTALVYGPTSTLITDPAEVSRLAQWPVAIGLHDVWRFSGEPHLVDDLDFADRTILAGSQDGIVHPTEAMLRLWTALKDWPIKPVALPLPGNFYDSGKPTLVIGKLPGIPTSAGAKEGDRVWRLQLRTERNSLVAKQAKELNLQRFGSMTCEACDFTHSDAAMFDAHHPTPLAVGKRNTLPEHLQILCPTCHRRAHRKSPLDPYQLHELRDWVAAGRR